MSTQLPLRDYQTAALAAVRLAWARGVQRPAVVAPTGAGKTVMFSHLIAEELRERPGTRALVLVHRDELADQAIDKIRQVMPGTWVGKVKASDNEIHASVVVASVQTLARGTRLDQLLRSQEDSGPLDRVIVDEAHHAVAPTWREVLDKLGAFNPNSGTQCVGFSATLARGDGIGLGSVWQEVAYAISLTRLIRRGYLADVRGRQVVSEDLDLAGVKRSGGDYQAGALGAAMIQAGTHELVAGAYLEHASDRQGVVFTPDVESAIATAVELNDIDIRAEVITGATPREERRLAYKMFEAGDLQVLVNCMVLTEGFDAPWASCAVIARPTRNAALYTQMVGRVLRPWPGKKDALVLDVVGASTDLKLATLIDLAPGKVRTIDPDETLADAVEAAELAEIADQAEREEYARQSKLTAKDVDLFAQSRSVWLRTRAGVWFIPTREGEIFLWPSATPGHWDVAHAGWMPATAVNGTKKRAPWERLHVGLSLDLAMSWAQTEAEELDHSVASRDASWRKSGRASDAQKSYLTKWYRPDEIPDGLKKAEASDMISVGVASKLFDRHYEKVS